MSARPPRLAPRRNPGTSLSIPARLSSRTLGQSASQRHGGEDMHESEWRDWVYEARARNSFNVNEAVSLSRAALTSAPSIASASESCPFRTSMSATKYCLALRITPANYCATRCRARISSDKFGQVWTSRWSEIDQAILMFPEFIRSLVLNGAQVVLNAT